MFIEVIKAGLRDILVKAQLACDDEVLAACVKDDSDRLAVGKAQEDGPHIHPSNLMWLP